jgi:hypothetical protein
VPFFFLTPPFPFFKLYVQLCFAVFFPTSPTLSGAHHTNKATMNWGVVRFASKTVRALYPWKPKDVARAYACFLVYLARKVIL